MGSLINLTGWVMKEHGVPDSKWTVLYQDKTKSKHGNHAYWICQCECGNIKSVCGRYLRNGVTKSCGCSSKEFNHNAHFHDLTGKRFGKLLVKRYIESRNQQLIWECQCDCGTIIEVSTANLNRGNTQSCGCLKSHGEQKISKILQNLKILYKKEYSFEDLRNIYPLRFDFAIFNNDKTIKCLIEYQGSQHYNTDNIWYRPDIDEKKRLYCLKNNIRLIEIPYTDYKKLSEDYLQKLIN